MKRSKFTEERIAFALKQQELGTSVEEVCRKMGISEATFRVWKKKYSGVGPSKLRRLRQLEEENRKLKQIVADLSLVKAMLQAVVAKKSLRPSLRRALVPELMQRFGCSERRALAVVKMSPSSYRYEARKRDEAALKLRIKEITLTRVHYGYRRVHVLLRREGHKDNVKRVYRIYREEGLSLRLKRPRRNKAAKLRQPKQLAHAMNEIWSADFVADELFDGRKLRMLTVVDCFTRECLAIDVGQSLKGEDVVDSLNRICAVRGLPKTIKADNARVESFNGRLRQECLNANWFLSLDDAKAKIGAWRTYYNESRPHSALDWLTPAEFARRCGLQAATAIFEKPEISTSGRS